MTKTVIQCKKRGRKPTFTPEEENRVLELYSSNSAEQVSAMIAELFPDRHLSPSGVRELAKRRRDAQNLETPAASTDRGCDQQDAGQAGPDNTRADQFPAAPSAEATKRKQAS